MNDAQRIKNLSESGGFAGDEGLLAGVGVVSAIAESINVNIKRKGEKQCSKVFTKSDVFGRGATLGVAP